MNGSGNAYHQEASTAPAQSLITLGHAVYALQAIGMFVGATWLIAIVVNYVKKEEVEGTWLESHFRWQIRTFWWGLLWFVLGTLTLLVLIGWVILVASGVWLVYRIVKGWLALADHRPIRVS